MADRGRPKTSRGLPRRRLELPLVAGLVVLALLLIAGFAVERRVATVREADATAINLAGRQRMLSQRIALLASRVDERSSRADTDLLRDAIDSMRADFERLSSAGGDVGLDVAGPVVEEQMIGGPAPLDERVEAFLQDAEAIAENPGSPSAGATTALVREARGPLLDDLEQAVSLREQASRESLAGLRRLIAINVAAALAALIALGLLVLRPVVRRVRREVNQVELLQDIAVSANAAPDAESAYADCLGLICRHTRWPVGHVYLVDDATGAVHTTGVWHLSDRSRYRSFIHVTEQRSLARGVGLPGRVVVSGEPAWIEDVRIDENFPRKPQAREAGLISGMAFPILARDQVVAVFEVFAHERIEPKPETIKILHQVGTQLGRVAERQRSEAELEHRALYDELTGLPNRALLNDRLARTLAAQRRHPERGAAVLFLDLDGFKFVNDTLGHGAGDEMLREVARRLSESTRAEDTVARFGGDEFVVICEPLGDGVDLQEMAERLRESLTPPIWLNGEAHTITASVGIAPTDARCTPEMLLTYADVAMYEAKRAGRGRVVEFQQDMFHAVEERSRVERDLRGAAARGEMRLHLQPIVELDSRETLSFEALVRWEHPERGLLAPFAFIEVAEESGLIDEIGHWVMEESCRLASGLGDGGSIAVNVSPRQLLDPDFTKRVRKALAAHGTPPERLTIEVTETAVIQRGEAPVARLSEVRELGVRVALDDFGTGFSSLGHLQSLPLDIVKLDRQFAMGLGESSSERTDAIVGAMATLADAIGLTLVVEGIEDEPVARRVQELGCEIGQGYHFARPAPAKEALASATRPALNPR